MKLMVSCLRVASTEVGFSLVRRSPYYSWTRGYLEHLIVPRGANTSGARLGEFIDKVPTPAESRLRNS